MTVTLHFALQEKSYHCFSAHTWHARAFCKRNQWGWKCKSLNVYTIQKAKLVSASSPTQIGVKIITLWVYRGQHKWDCHNHNPQGFWDLRVWTKSKTNLLLFHIPRVYKVAKLKIFHFCAKQVIGKDELILGLFVCFCKSTKIFAFTL